LSNPKPNVDREWDAAAYHRLSGPQVSWGEKVLSRLDLAGNETVLDAGCGTGRLTASVIDALPRGRVIAVDLSENMLRAGRAYLTPRRHPALHFVAANLASLPLHNRLDGIFSTASFHWIPDHVRLFRSLFAALRPGGWLVAQCGGGPNLARFRQRVRALCQEAPYSSHLSTFKEPWFFSDAETADRNLRDAGFIEIETSIEPALTTFADAEHFIQFVQTAIVHRHLALIPDPVLRQSFLNALALQSETDIPPFELDYWRLNMRARRPA
jgi:trans-aconitate 2-methyltransferase